MATVQGQGERKTMRGWAHSTPGRPETVLKLRNDLPYPSVVGPTEVLVAISHAALNPGASIFTTLLPMFMRTKPSIPDMDFAGKIVSVGADVLTSRDLKAGTRVFGSVPVPQYVGKARGSMAEFVVVPAENVCATPDNLPAEQAAGLGIAGCSAVTVLEAAKLKAGDKVLINGASGGVGSLTVQIVRNAIGTTGRIVAICSGRNVEMVKALGADEVSRL
jgi:NADPH:quinone reductase-like Zn-dependent oxidoreductase